MSLQSHRSYTQPSRLTRRSSWSWRTSCTTCVTLNAVSQWTGHRNGRPNTSTGLAMWWRGSGERMLPWRPNWTPCSGSIAHLSRLFEHFESRKTFFDWNGETVSNGSWCFTRLIYLVIDFSSFFYIKKYLSLPGYLKILTLLEYFPWKNWHCFLSLLLQ